MTARASDTARRVLVDCGKRLVRRVAAEDSEASAALFHVAAAGRANWTLTDWNILLARLEKSDLTVSAWLEQTLSDWTA